MATVAYVPKEVTFEGQALDSAILVTLYNVDSESPNGAVTTMKPLPAETIGGPLVINGRREGKQWRVHLPRISVRNKSACGFEFDIQGPVEMEALSDDATNDQGKISKGLGDFGATF